MRNSRSFLSLARPELHVPDSWLGKVKHEIRRGCAQHVPAFPSLLFLDAGSLLGLKGWRILSREACGFSEAHSGTKTADKDDYVHHKPRGRAG